jgi:hypothetical protein
MGIKFSVLQQLISKTLGEYKDAPFGAAIFAISQLLQKLVEFSFYISIDKIKDVSAPLVATLNRKDVVYAVETVASKSLARRSSIRQSKRMSLKDRALKAAQQAAKEVSAEASETVNDDELEIDSWQRRLLSFMDSLRWLCVIMCVVFFAIAIAAYQFIAGDDSDVWTGNSIIFFIDLLFCL